MYTNDITAKEHKKRQKSFASSDGEIKYIDEGSGEVILLLHGIPTSSWLYRKMVSNLVEKGFRVIAPDMLGFGNSDSPKGYDIYASKEHAKRIIELMDFLQIESWAHLMHDAGGLWTWELLKNNATRVNRLVILNTLILEEGFFPPVKMKEGALSKFTLSLYRNKMTSTILLKMLFNNGLQQHSLSKKELEAYRKPLIKGKTDALYYFFTQLSKLFPNYTTALKNLNIPIMVIWGKHDKILRRENQKDNVLKLLDVKKEDIHIIEGNHFVQEETPNKITTLINKNVTMA